MARELNVQTEDWQALLKQHSLMELLNPLAQEKLKVIIMERKLLEIEAQLRELTMAVGAPVEGRVNGELTEKEIDQEMSKAWEKADASSGR